jgi:hypothetical protein
MAPIHRFQDPPPPVDDHQFPFAHERDRHGFFPAVPLCPRDRLCPTWMPYTDATSSAVQKLQGRAVPRLIAGELLYVSSATQIAVLTCISRTRTSPTYTRFCHCLAWPPNCPLPSCTPYGCPEFRRYPLHSRDTDLIAILPDSR